MTAAIVYTINILKHVSDLQITFLLPTFVTLIVTIMNTRLKQFISAENITQAQFADTINVVRASVSHILAGRNKPSYEFICGLMRHYPNLNIEWLMFGKGKMYKDTSVQPGDLFTEEPESYSAPFALPEEENFELTEPVITEQQPHIEIKTLVKEVQKPVIQRKIVKVMAFFDDGTFQELHSI